jgi:hypothetical protein
VENEQYILIIFNIYQFFLNMIHYYINPKTQELIAFDDETREVAVMEPVGGIIQTESKLAKPVSSPSKPAYVPNQRKQRLCSVCQKPGHTATTCLKNRPSNFGLFGVE